MRTPLRMSCADTLKSALSLWRPAILLRTVAVIDLRQEADFLVDRLYWSYNLPVSQLTDLQFLLPDKHSKLLLITPHAHCSVPSGLQPCSVEEHLRAAGWKDIVCTLAHSPDLWDAAQQLGIVERGCTDIEQLRRRWLFKACPLLSEEIKRVELSLVCHSHASCYDRSLLFTCLDMGCGKGRDLVWLCCRSHEYAVFEAAFKAEWAVVGVDSMKAAVVDARRLFNFAGIPEPRWQILQGKAKQTLNCDSRQTTSQSAVLPSKFNLILYSRFIDRSSFKLVGKLLQEGGFVLVSSFVDGPGVQRFGRPKGPHLLQPGELRSSWFGDSTGFHVLRDDIVLGSDGRELSMFVARKMPLPS